MEVVNYGWNINDYGLSSTLSSFREAKRKWNKNDDDFGKEDENEDDKDVDDGNVDDDEDNEDIENDDADSDEGYDMESD